VKEALAETAEIARAEEEYWKSEVQRALPAMWNESERRLAATKGMPLALARRVVRGAAESLGVRLEFRQVEEILGLAKSASAMLPGWVVSRSQNGWQFEPERNAAPVSDYEYALPVPGMVQVPEAGSRFEVTVVPGEGVTGYNPDHVFDPALLQQELTVRNWRAGDRFWPAHTKSPKKVKELLQERKLAERERKLWPVVVSGEEIVWVRGFPGPARLRHRDGAERALVIQEHAKP
jgi:tRNA(Ile)-lysidine synthase